eukprot:1280147-Amphidinium_carterae.1
MEKKGFGDHNSSTSTSPTQLGYYLALSDWGNVQKACQKLTKLVLLTMSGAIAMLQTSLGSQATPMAKAWY